MFGHKAREKDFLPHPPRADFRTTWTSVPLSRRNLIEMSKVLSLLLVYAIIGRRYDLGTGLNGQERTLKGPDACNLRVGRVFAPPVLLEVGNFLLEACYHTVPDPQLRWGKVNPRKS